MLTSKVVSREEWIAARRALLAREKAHMRAGDVIAAERRVVWEVVSGPEDWVGTEISFDLRQEDDYTILLFKHQGWREPTEFMHHCSTKWGTFLMSLKSLLENGKAAAWPDDVKIDNLEAAAA